MKSKIGLVILLMIGYQLSFGATHFPVIVTDLKGQKIITHQPKRIAALEISFVDDLTALGLTPACFTISEDVGGSFNQLGPSYLLHYNADLRQVPQVGSREHPNLEALLNCKPDLILADNARDGIIYDQLTQIGPTLLLDSLRVSYPEMMVTFEKVAKATGHQHRAEKILREQQQVVTKAKAIAANNHENLLVVNLYPDSTIKAFTDASYIAQLFGVLNKPYALKAKHGEIVQTITVEGLLAINPDSIVVLLTDGNAAPLHQWQKSALWQQLPAVKNDKVYVADRALWVQSPGILSSRQIMHQAMDNGLLAGKSKPLSQQKMPEPGNWR